MYTIVSLITKQQYCIITKNVLMHKHVSFNIVLSQLNILVKIYYGSGGGGVEQYSTKLSCFTGLVKLIRSVESWLAAVVVEFLLHGIGGGGAKITVFFWFVLKVPGLGRLLHWDLQTSHSKIIFFLVQFFWSNKAYYLKYVTHTYAHARPYIYTQDDSTLWC